MVTINDTTTIMTEPKVQGRVQPSLKRWFKHFCYLPASKRYFDRQDQFAIAAAVKQAEQGHVGEIQVVIEGHIPSHQAYYQNVRSRAEQLFAELGVWDTEQNSGILVYLNLCEQAVEIVVDRGINQATTQQEWQKICNDMLLSLKQKQYRAAVVQGILDIGQILNQFYAGSLIDQENELSDFPKIMN